MHRFTRVRNGSGNSPRLLLRSRVLLSASVVSIALTTSAASTVLLIAPATSLAAGYIDYEIVRDEADGTPKVLRFAAFGRHFELKLRANSGLIAPGAAARIVGPGGSSIAPHRRSWIGSSDDGSEARLEIRRRRLRGSVRTPSGTFVLATPPARSRYAGLLDVRRAEDELAESEGIRCSEHGDGLQAPAAPTAPALLAGRQLVTTHRILDISVLADAAFYRRFGTSSVERIQALFNQVDGIYRSELGVTLRIVQLHIYETDDAQPFATATTASDLLGNLSIARRDDEQRSFSAGAVTHLLTAAPVSGGTGMAWLGGVCDRLTGASLSVIDSEIGYRDALLVAHEIAHNLGAIHDGQPSSACANAPAGYVMWPYISAIVTDEFSPCSQEAIAAKLTSAECANAWIAPTCGNGAIDAGEQCDGSACCRSDCSFDLAGMRCGDSGDVCMDAVCDAGGQCVNVPNTADCSAEDVCMQGRCSDGTCLSVDSPRTFDTVKASYRIDDGGMITSAKVKATAALLNVGSDPSQAGLELVATMGNLMAWNEFVPAEGWERKANGNFSFKAEREDGSRVRAAKVRLNAATGRASFKFSLVRPMTSMPPASPTLFVLAGDRTDGQCAAAPTLSCRNKGASYTCE